MCVCVFSYPSYPFMGTLWMHVNRILLHFKRISGGPFKDECFFFANYSFVLKKKISNLFLRLNLGLGIGRGIGRALQLSTHQ